MGLMRALLAVYSSCSISSNDNDLMRSQLDNSTSYVVEDVKQG